MKIYIFYILLLCLSVVHAPCIAGNPNDDRSINSIFIQTIKDTIYSPGLPSIEIEGGTYNNINNTTNVEYTITLRGSEIRIDSVKLYKEVADENNLTIFNTLEPINLHVGDSTDKSRIDIIHMKNRFPYNKYFALTDSLIIFTDKGPITHHLVKTYQEQLELKDEIRQLSGDILIKNNLLLKNKTDNKKLIIVFSILIGILIIISGIYMCLLYGRRKRQEIEMAELNAIISENEKSKDTLKSHVNELLRSHFDTINKLCYEYFEKADTQVLKKSIYNQVEKEINKFKAPENISKLETMLDKYNDNIVTRIDERLPFLTSNERKLMILILSGLAVRTICIMLDIQLKNYYMRRQRLKMKIASSDIPDKDFFISLLNN